jgi:hypothetical protein
LVYLLNEGKYDTNIPNKELLLASPKVTLPGILLLLLRLLTEVVVVVVVAADVAPALIIGCW